MKIKTACIELTNLCNLNCKSCYNRSGLNHEREEISLEQFAKGLDTLLSQGCKRLLLAGGEPTMHSRFDEIMELLQASKIESAGVTTNGVIHSMALIELVNSDERFHIQVSIDGSCEDINAKTRGAGSFEKPAELLKKIKGCKSKTRIKMTISKRNLSDVEDFYRFAVNEGGLPEFAFITRQGNAVDGFEDISLTGVEKMNVIKLICKLNEEFAIDVALPLCSTGCPFIVGTREMSVLIRPTGGILPCQVMVDDRYILANLLDFDEDEFEKNTQDLFALAKQRLDTDYGCKKCMVRMSCKRGCMALALHETDNPLGNDGQCDFLKRQWGDRNFLAYLTEKR